MTLIRYVEKYLASENDLVRIFATLLDEWSLWLIAFSATYIFLYTLWPQCLKPSREKKKLKRTLLTRINKELFDADMDNHRITLFKEVCWFRAAARNFIYFIFHLLRYPKKCLLHLKLPKLGRYLKVDSRCGLRFKKSSTMFRVEKNEREKCEGIVGCIRYSETSLCVGDLPDLSDIDFNKYKTVMVVPTNKRRDVRNYMERGCINDFNLLKKIHRRARHFYGTIIEKNGNIWGVLLVDSTSPTNPFSETVMSRLDSFALTIGSIIQMEV